MKRLIPFLAFLYYTSVAAQLNINSVIQAQMTQQNIPAVSALIVKNNEPVWFKAYGKGNVDADINATSNMAFMLASVSKTVTATALMQVWENGGFDLDENINNHLPFQVSNPNFPNASITFRHLLTHTAGIVDNWDVLDNLYVDGDSPISLADFCSGYFTPGGTYYDADLNFANQAPGMNYEYSNASTTLCGYLVESITGIDFNQYCRDSIFTPLCMDNTGWFLIDMNQSNLASPHYFESGSYVAVPHYGYADYPDGQLRTNSTSLGRFLVMYMNGGQYNGTRILESQTVDLMLSEQVPAISPGQGLIWYSDTQSGKTYWGHNGGDLGVSTEIRYFREDSIGIVLLTNGDDIDLDPLLDNLLAYALELNTTGAGYPCGSLLSNEELVFTPNSALKVYPNPANGYINLEVGKPGINSTVALYDITGKKVNEQVHINTDKLQIDISKLNSGLYTVVWDNLCVRFAKD